jgi:hypothetical protein
MSVSDFTRDASTERRRSKLPAIIASVFIACAILAGAAWGPTVLAVASNLRPVGATLNAVPPQGEIDAARQQMWTVAGFSFIALGILAWSAFGVAHWGFPATAAQSERREKWAMTCLIGGVGLALLVPFVLQLFRNLIPVPLAEGILFIPITLASAVASFIICGTALPSADSVWLPGELRPTPRLGVRICLVASILIACVLGLLVAFIAQVVVGLFLHFV